MRVLEIPRGPVMLDVEGLLLEPADIDRLRHPLVGGVILFARNFENQAQLKILVSDIHELRRPSLLVAVDQEGGRVQRFKHDFTIIPAAGMSGKLAQQDFEGAKQLAKDCGWVMAAELRSLGVDISFAPVLDLNIANNSVIGERAFEKDPDKVIELAGSYINGMDRAGMAATGKHFPGHGAVMADSHFELPTDYRELDELWGQDLKPYRALCSNDLSAVMTGHLVFPRVDTRAVTFSVKWLQEILRKKIGFQGLVFSDDLAMVAAHSQGAPSERATAALMAGCDMILYCNDPGGGDEILDNLKVAPSNKLHERLCLMQPKDSSPQPDTSTLLSARQRIAAAVA